MPGAIATGPSALGKVIIDGKGRDQQTFRLDGLDATPLVDLPSGDAAISIPDSFQKQSVTAIDLAHTTVISGAFPALNGPGTGSETESATSPGRLIWTGQYYEVLRNDALDARNFFDYERKDAIRKSLFGGKVEGPLTRNKRALFFLGYEGVRGRTERNLYEGVPGDAVCQCGVGPAAQLFGDYLPRSTSVVNGASLNPDFLVARRRVRNTSQTSPAGPVQTN